MTQLTERGSECPVDHRFDPFDAAYLDDPYPELARVRGEHPVFYAPAVDMYVVTRHADVEAVFMDPARFSAAITLSPLFPPPPAATAVLAEGLGATPTMSNCDPPRHGRIRRHNMKAFSARRMAVLEPVVRARAEAMVSDLLGRRSPTDLVEPLAFPLPAVTIFALVGFPEGDTELLKSWCGDRLSVTWGRPEPDAAEETARNMVAYWRYCEDFVAGRLAVVREEERGGPPAPDDFTTDLLRVHLADPDELSVADVTNVAFGLSFAGHETTTSMLANLIRRVLEHRDQWEALCADPDLIPGAVEEALRYDTSVIAWRRITTQPVEIGGVPLPEGAKLLLLLGAAGRDPARFAEPDRFDVRRPDARAHLAFGKGIHFCLGASLARMQAQIVLELLTRLAPSLTLVEEQELRFPPNVSFRGPRRLLVRW